MLGVLSQVLRHKFVTCQVKGCTAGVGAPDAELSSGVGQLTSLRARTVYKSPTPPISKLLQNLLFLLPAAAVRSRTDINWLQYCSCTDLD